MNFLHNNPLAVMAIAVSVAIIAATVISYWMIG